MTESEFFQWILRLYSNMMHQDNRNTESNKRILISAQKRLFTIYKKGAKKRKIPFNLDMKTLVSFLSKVCSYCGAPPCNCLIPESRNRKFGKTLYNGIDRKDNSKGYEADNCHTCCWTCNNAKRNMTEKEFKQWASKTYINLTLPGRLSHAF